LFVDKLILLFIFSMYPKMYLRNSLQKVA